MSNPVRRFFVAPDATVREVMETIDRNARGIALVVDEEGRLIQTLTDGDIRRGILAGVALQRPARELLELRTGGRHEPLTVDREATEAEMLRLMKDHGVRHLPVLDSEGRVVDLAMVDAFLQEEEPLPLSAVVMAGGFGRRLRPLTEDVPKPMLPLGDRPLLERILDGLKRSGVHNVRLTTHYKAEVIREHFGDGTEFGLDLGYLEEDQPLGTAGALGLMEPMDTPLLVMNGDILTDLDVRALLDFHREQKARMTVGVRRYEIPVPYGVVETEKGLVTRIQEKPVLHNFVSAGIYLLEPNVLERIERGRPLDMPDLIDGLLREGQPVACFPVREYWVDIGQMDDYQRARDDVERRGEDRDNDGRGKP